jgi:hypothetical protein
MPDLVHELLATEAAIGKLGLAPSPPTRPASSRATSTEKRRLMIGRTDGGRVLTLVIEQTIESTTWLIVTGWSSTEVERNLLER